MLGLRLAASGAETSARIDKRWRHPVRSRAASWHILLLDALGTIARA
jgi:hypothetical protein